MATTKKRIQVTFTDEQLEMLEKMAKEKGFTKSAILALALEEYEKLQKNA
ncbi:MULTISPECIES: CopG family transcriptional regulator [Bacilli]|jgi:metal-responsive CopG/Arc/MetJ family transcriptional regulator|uniref:CopG family transcriptional regulator n=1 Tax=Staphylococcus debuckii TaxID=2044912 RepID=A0ABU9F142_9STAP|nr:MULTISPECIES: CopG family transcriptional regulator [Bacilli]MCI2928421.1 ribbon-helix-helix domain-containing protein [Staphylococcus hominis]MDT4035164.1 CopG family transcriptional regulator [Staphylococcus hominis]NAM96416.1 CopG family transcriptional regulator [Staphylococcus hominis]CIT26052.1 Ribbon-helix-helix protein%2C copG family [Streptococcus pneumoniae]SCS11266.1 Ribbon-helix-helix protein, copG family [Staphylococcus aureus]